MILLSDETPTPQKKGSTQKLKLSHKFTKRFKFAKSIMKRFVLALLALLVPTLVSGFVPQNKPAFVPRITNTELEAAPTMVVY